MGQRLMPELAVVAVAVQLEGNTEVRLNHLHSGHLKMIKHIVFVDVDL